jgi:hypothetical protein
MKHLTNIISLEGEQAEVFREKLGRPVSAVQKKSIRKSTGTYELYRAKWEKKNTPK